MILADELQVIFQFLMLGIQSSELQTGVCVVVVEFMLRTFNTFSDPKKVLISWTLELLSCCLVIGVGDFVKTYI